MIRISSTQILTYVIALDYTDASNMPI